MMDLAMVGILLVCLGLMKLFTEWCSRQVDDVGAGSEE